VLLANVKYVEGKKSSINPQHISARKTKIFINHFITVQRKTKIVISPHHNSVSISENLHFSKSHKYKEPPNVSIDRIITLQGQIKLLLFPTYLGKEN